MENNINEPVTQIAIRSSFEEGSRLVKQEGSKLSNTGNTVLAKQGDNKLVKQPYCITMARYRLNVHELRIMTKVIEYLQTDMQYNKDRTAIKATLLGDCIVRIPTKELVLADSKNYLPVRHALRSLEEKSINVFGKDSYGNYETHAKLVMKSKYYLNNQMVEIQLDRDLLPDMLALARNYSQYMTDIVFNSSSTYTARLYMFISHWKDKPKITVMLDSLRSWLDLGDKYKTSRDIKKFILEPASKDLKNRADVWFDIGAPIKEGKSIVGYVFKLYMRAKNKDLALAYVNNTRFFLTECFGLGSYYLKQLEPIISKPELRQHIHEKLHEIYGYVQKGNIKNVKSYVVKALQNEFRDYLVEVKGE